MKPEADLRVRLWLSTFRTMARYFRFEVSGLEHLRGESALLVGYHGGPWAFDAFFLSARMHDELGAMPRAIWLRAWQKLPLIRGVVDAVGGMYGPPDEATIAAMRARREHLIVLPGGTREALRPYWRRGRVDFGDRRGYAHLALRHGLPIVPMASTGLDETFIGLVDGYSLSRRLFGHGGVPIWLAIGLGGLWPFALPFPTKIRLALGAPVDVTALGDVERVHRVVTDRIQELLDAGRARSFNGAA